MTEPRRARVPRRVVEWRREIIVTALAVGAAVAVTVGLVHRSHTIAPTAEQIAAASDTAAAIATEVETPSGTHLGFDTSEYPGDDAMRAWKAADVNYEWVGYYLPAPCHKDDSWSGKRTTLTGMGWGLAVVYVGQQTWGRTPGVATVRTRWVTKREKRRVKVNGRYVTRTVTRKVPVTVREQPRVLPGQSCSTHLVTGAQGIQDADDAIAVAQGEGFPRGTVVFLDIERMENVPSAMRDYYRAWVGRLLADGRYKPGVYVHTHNAAQIHVDVTAEYAKAGVKEEPAFWVAGGSGFAPEKVPSDVGHAFAAMWQGVLDIVQTHNGVKLPIDVNVAAVPSPSGSLSYLGQLVDETTGNTARGRAGTTNLSE